MTFKEFFNKINTKTVKCVKCGGDIEIADGVDCVINGGTFSVDPATINATVNGTVVDNGDGTWTVK